MEGLPIFFSPAHVQSPVICIISRKRKKDFGVWDATQVMCNVVDLPIELQWL